MQARLAVHGERVVYPMLMHVEGKIPDILTYYLPSHYSPFRYLPLHCLPYFIYLLSLFSYILSLIFSHSFLSPVLSHMPINTPYRIFLSTYLPIINTVQHIISTHPFNTSYQHTLSTHPFNPPFQHIISTHPFNTSYQHTN